MDNHISKEFHDLCRLCIERCQKTVDDIRALLIDCELNNIIAKCENDLNKTIIISDESIALCEKVMDHALQHLKNCNDQECKQACDAIVYACKECIKACGDVEIECDHNLEACVNVAKNCKEKSKLCIDAINKYLKIVKNKS